MTSKITWREIAKREGEQGAEQRRLRAKQLRKPAPDIPKHNPWAEVTDAEIALCRHYWGEFKALHVPAPPVSWLLAIEMPDCKDKDGKPTGLPGHLMNRTTGAPACRCCASTCAHCEAPIHRTPRMAVWLSSRAHAAGTKPCAHTPLEQRPDWSARPEGRVEDEPEPCDACLNPYHQLNPPHTCGTD